MTCFIVIFSLVWWSGTKPTMSLTVFEIYLDTKANITTGTIAIYTLKTKQPFMPSLLFYFVKVFIFTLYFR